MNDATKKQIHHEIANLTEGLAGEQQALTVLRTQVTRAEVRIFHKQNQLRALRESLKEQS